MPSEPKGEILAGGLCNFIPSMGRPIAAVDSKGQGYQQ